MTFCRMECRFGHGIVGFLYSMENGGAVWRCQFLKSAIDRRPYHRILLAKSGDGRCCCFCPEFTPEYWFCLCFYDDSSIFGNWVISIVFSQKPSVWPLVVVYFLRMNSFVKSPMSLCWASSFAGISFGVPYGQGLRALILTGVPPTERRCFAVPILIFYKFFFVWSVLHKNL